MNTKDDIEKSLSRISLGDFDPDLCARLESAMNNCMDDKELSHVEEQLSSLIPASLDDSSMSDIVLEMENVEIESLLMQLTPASCSNDLLLRLESKMDSAQNTIELPKVTHAQEASKGRKFLKFSAVAAAAVVMCIITLDFRGVNKGDQLITDIKSVTENLSVPYKMKGDDSITTISNIVNASNEGIVIKDTQPHQAVKVLYEKVIYTKDEYGNPIELKIPFEKTLFTPTEIY